METLAGRIDRPILGHFRSRDQRTEIHPWWRGIRSSVVAMAGAHRDRAFGPDVRPGLAGNGRTECSPAAGAASRSSFFLLSCAIRLGHRTVADRKLQRGWLDSIAC